MSKFYFGLRITFIRIKSIFIIIFFKILGLMCGSRTIFYSRPNIMGYLNKIKIGKGCTFHENVKIIINKEGKLTIGSNTLISSNVNINAGVDRINIGSNVMIAANTYIINNDHNVFKNLDVRSSGHISKSITIQDNVWIGANCIILKGVNIGEGAIIGAGSVVTKDIKPYSINYGAPCKFLKYRFSKDELMKKLKDENYNSTKVEMIIKKTFE